MDMDGLSFEEHDLWPSFDKPHLVVRSRQVQSVRTAGALGVQWTWTPWHTQAGLDADKVPTYGSPYALLITNELQKWLHLM